MAPQESLGMPVGELQHEFEKVEELDDNIEVSRAGAVHGK
jgi:hypothetical protein